MKNIAIIYGSDSSEWEIAVRSGEFTASQIDPSRYNVYEIFARFGSWTLVAYREEGAERVVVPSSQRSEVDKTQFTFVVPGAEAALRPDFVYIMQHGTPGENGLLQGYFQMIGIPYSGCNAFVSSVIFDKYSCKNYLRDLPYIKCARDIFLRKGQQADPQAWASYLGLPMFIKPTDGGSSFGVTKVKKVEDILPAVEAAFAQGDMLIAESGLSGREITCAVYTADAEVKSLPIIEIVPHTEWFDYEAKYNGLSDEICPATISKQQWDQTGDVSRRLYKHLGCEGLVRFDYILCEDGLYFLEANTIPGMTSASLVPKMVRTAGMQMKDFLTYIIEGKCC